MGIKCDHTSKELRAVLGALGSVNVTYFTQWCVVLLGFLTHINAEGREYPWHSLHIDVLIKLFSYRSLIILMMRARVLEQALNTDRWTIVSLTHNLHPLPPPPPSNKALLICHLEAHPPLRFVLFPTQTQRDSMWRTKERNVLEENTLNFDPCNPSL